MGRNKIVKSPSKYVSEIVYDVKAAGKGKTNKEKRMLSKTHSRFQNTKAQPVNAAMHSTILNRKLLGERQQADAPLGGSAVENVPGGVNQY